MDKAVAYSFLAVIKERKGNIDSLIEIYEELVQALVLKLHSKKTKGGLISDFRGYFQDTYGFTIPIPTIKTIFSRIVDREKGKITLFQDNSFTVEEIDGENYDDIIEVEKDRVEEIFKMYDTYIEVRGLNKGDYNLFDYIESTKRHIIKYLNGEVEFDTSGDVQAEFLKELINIPEYRDRIHRLFLGSLISSYFDLEIDDSTKDSKLLLLDTNCIISLIGLHSVESEDNCKMIVSIAKELKYKVEVLPFTLEETRSLLLRIAGQLNKSTFFQAQDKNSIFYGCFRNNITSDRLVMIANKFQDRLVSEFKITIVESKVDDVLRGRAQRSDIYSVLKKRQNNPDGALHDSSALLYVRDNRIGDPHTFKDINSWFVSDTKGISENSKILEKNVPLIIRAEELLNILWLAHPIIDEKALSKNIVLKAISSTLINCLPGKKMLKEMDKTIDSIRDYPINSDDCVKIAENLACYDSTELKLLMEREHQKEILEKLHRAASIAEEREEENKERLAEFWEKIKDQFEESKRREIGLVRIQHAKERGKIEVEKTNEMIKENIDNIEILIDRDREDLEIVNSDISERITIPSERQTRITFCTIGLVNVVLFVIISIIVIRNWNKVEPYLAIFPMIPWIITYFIYVLTYKQISIGSIIATTGTRISNKLKSKHFRLIERKKVLEDRIELNTKKLDELRKSLIY